MCVVLVLAVTLCMVLDVVVFDVAVVAAVVAV